MDDEDVESLYSSEAEELYENSVQQVEVTHDEDVCKNVPSLDSSESNTRTDTNTHGFIGGSSSNVNAPIQRPIGLPYVLPYEFHGAYNFGGQHGYQMPSMTYPSYMYPQGVIQPSFQGPAQQLHFSDQLTLGGQDTFSQYSTGHTYQLDP